jgi:hypothetical protein
VCRKDEEFYVTDRDPFGVGTFASEWWRIVRRSKDAARSSDASDPGKARAEGLAPITYFRITRPAQKEFSFKVSTKKAASIAELQRHCGFANGSNGSATTKKSKKSSKSSSSPTKKNESESEDDDWGNDSGSGNKLKSLQKDRPMQSGKRPPSRFQSLRKIAKERMKLGDFVGGGGGGDGSGSSPSSPASKESKKAGKKNNSNVDEQQQLKESDKGVKTTFITSDAETNRVLSDLQQEREWRDVIEKAVYCADFTQFVTISSGPSFSSSSTATPTRAGAIRRSADKKSSSYRGNGSSDSSDQSDSDDDSTASSRSSKHGDDEVDDEREEKMLAGVQELVAYIKKHKVFEDPENSLSFARLLRTALRATVQVQTPPRTCTCTHALRVHGN